MTSFVHIDYPVDHPGVLRAERAIGNIQQAARAFDATRAAGSLLLAAIVAALMVVANQVIDTWTEGHLLAAWIVMWLVAFAAIALFAAPAKRAAKAMRAVAQRWAAARKQAAEDQQLWNLALTDARVMADISRAMSADALRDVKAYY
jgi:ABC-type transport system involved in cytochrome bd biosynthesis fused ATPase/permease subunit